jgi:hypothetical protein
MHDPGGAPDSGVPNTITRPKCQVKPKRGAAAAKKRFLSFEKEVFNPAMKWLEANDGAPFCLALRAELYVTHILLRKHAIRMGGDDVGE